MGNTLRERHGYELRESPYRNLEWEVAPVGEDFIVGFVRGWVGYEAYLCVAIGDDGAWQGEPLGLHRTLDDAYGAVVDAYRLAADRED